MLNILLFPIKLFFKFVGLILALTGKIFGMIIGLIIMLSGIICCMTIIGFFIGIPLVIIGVSIFIGALF